MGSSKDTQYGIILIIAATFFLMSGLDILEYKLFEETFSTMIAFGLVAVGVYMIAKQK